MLNIPLYSDLLRIFSLYISRFSSRFIPFTPYKNSAPVFVPDYTHIQTRRHIEPPKRKNLEMLAPPSVSRTKYEDYSNSLVDKNIDTSTMCHWTKEHNSATPHIHTNTYTQRKQWKSLKQKKWISSTMRSCWVWRRSIKENAIQKCINSYWWEPGV